MKKSGDIALYITEARSNEWLISQLMNDELPGLNFNLKDLKGEIFSNHTIQYVLLEETRHDHYEIETPNHNPMKSSSSGEQRKALLYHLIKKRPDYIIVENVFDSLDVAARQVITVILQDISLTTPIIQIFSRRHELLPFIDKVFTLNGTDVIACQYSPQFLNSHAINIYVLSTGTIPPPPAGYPKQNGVLVKMNNVNVAFEGRPVLQNINWEIMPGEFWQLTGPNGSGKSTLLSLITGNSPKAYGQELYLFGKLKGSGETVWQIKEKIGYFTPGITFQFERLDTIEQMVISGFFDSVGLYSKPTDRQIYLAGEWLKLIRMVEIKNQPFRMLPDGQQRMVLIARAMVKHPPMLILDEPLSGLNDDMAALFVSLINKIALETTTAILYVSHRKEKGLNPALVFKLFPSDLGSTGRAFKS